MSLVQTSLLDVPFLPAPGCCQRSYPPVARKERKKPPTCSSGNLKSGPMFVKGFFLHSPLTHLPI